MPLAIFFLYPSPENCSCPMVTLAIHLASCFCSNSYVKAGLFEFKTNKGDFPSSNLILLFKKITHST